MHARSLYLDTSVIGGYFDPEFMADTRALWRLREAGRFRFVSSVLVDQEIARAPKPVRALMRTTFAPADMLPMAAEALELAAHYLAQKVVTRNYTDEKFFQGQVKKRKRESEFAATIEGQIRLRLPPR